MSSRFLLRLLVILCTAYIVQTYRPFSALAQTAGTVSASGEVLKEVRELLARELGVDPAALSEKTDLVRDLNLDQAQVYYAVLAVFESQGVAPPKKELTLVGDIVQIIAAAKAPDRPHLRAFAAPTANSSYIQTVYYATDRKPTGDATPDGFFGAERALNGQISYGSDDINIPYTHKAGHIETPWLKIEQLRDPRKHLYTLRLNPMNEKSFFSEITSVDGKNDILVFVHGFNTPFSEALVRAAQISFDFGFEGETIVFSWPSQGSLTAYNSDSENALWSAKHLELFLETLSDKANGRKIHLIAHSMGSKVLLNALRLVAYRGAKTSLFATVILSAPDFDAGLFHEQLAAEVKPLAAQFAIYSSRKDVALMASEKLNMETRLGTPLTLADGYEIIDASDVEVTPWSVPETHSYYSTKKVVIDDMFGIMKGLTAAERGLKRTVSAAGIYWSLK